MSVSPDGHDDEGYIAKLHEIADQIGDEAFCYFIAADHGPVKIGHASDVSRRLRELQHACPFELFVLAAVGGGEVRECAYHRTFAAHRLHGEWFERCPEILAEIDRLSNASGE